MAWNEPGGGKDPWGSNDNPGPPDLDEIWKKFRSRFGGGGKKGNGGGGGGPSNISLSLILVAALLIWFFSGFYIVQEAERGVVLQFGEHVVTKDPGLRWIPRFIRSVEKVDIKYVYSVSDQSTMLTQDENIVDIDLEAQYQVRNPEQYLFNLRDPDDTLLQAMRSAVREVAGKNNMEFILTDGREEIAGQTQDLLQSMLDEYESGLLVTQVNLQDAQPPDQVQAAFDDVIKAREDKERATELANAYANDILPRAEGNAARQVAEANAYRERVVARAEGEAERFEKLLLEYRKAPEVTRERLYLDAMQRVLGNSSKVLIDSDGGAPLFYLPLDQMVKGRGNRVINDPTGSNYPTSQNQGSGSSGGSSSSSGDNSSRSRSRGR